jgi:hypothetical protein
MLTHHIDNLRMQQTVGDFSLFFARTSGQLLGLSGTYVDDILRAVTPKWLASTTATTESTFETQAPKKKDFTFIGLQLSTSKNSIKMAQQDYNSRISLLPTNSTYEAYRSTRAKLAWASTTRPDISCAVSMASQVTEAKFKINFSANIRSANAVIKHLRNTPDINLTYPRLDKTTLRLSFTLMQATTTTRIIHRRSAT